MNNEELEIINHVKESIEQTLEMFLFQPIDAETMKLMENTLACRLVEFDIPYSWELQLTAENNNSEVVLTTIINDFVNPPIAIIGKLDATSKVIKSDNTHDRFDAAMKLLG